jgi:hypothetical protein
VNEHRHGHDRAQTERGRSARGQRAAFREHFLLGSADLNLSGLGRFTAP